MNYQNGWTFRDDATVEQLDAVNASRLDDLADEAASLFRQIPEPDGGDYEHRRLVAIAKVLWRRIEVIEELMHNSGARFVRNNEEHQEFERHLNSIDY